jgi:hypothetical protein
MPTMLSLRFLSHHSLPKVDFYLDLGISLSHQSLLVLAEAAGPNGGEPTPTHLGHVSQTKPGKSLNQMGVSF